MARSKPTQNEIINITAGYIHNENTKCLQNESSVFSIIADEATDKYANEENLAVFLHFVEGNEVKELFC